MAGDKQDAPAGGPRTFQSGQALEAAGRQVAGGAPPAAPDLEEAKREGLVMPTREPAARPSGQFREAPAQVHQRHLATDGHAVEDEGAEAVRQPPLP